MQSIPPAKSAESTQPGCPAQPDRPVDVAVVGGGAAGLAAAIFAARGLPPGSVVVLDGAGKLGAKILVAGGGRCNVTNRTVTPADFCGGSRNVIKRVLAAFPAIESAAFFESLGVGLHEEEHGKLFPDTNKAQTVVDALLAEARRCGVRILLKQRVIGIARGADGFEITTGVAKPVVATTASPRSDVDASDLVSSIATGDAARPALTARRVVLATGGKSLPKSGSDGHGYVLAQALGHTLIPTTPALEPLVLEGDFHRGLSGIAQDVELTVQAVGDKPTRVRGALLWTHFGVSGPAVLDVSRHWRRARLAGRSVQVTVNFLPGVDFESAEAQLRTLGETQPRTQLHNALAGLLPGRVADALLAAAGLPPGVPMAHFARGQRRTLAHALIGWPLPVVDGRGYTFAEVTAGGVPLAEIDPRTMESRVCPGLHLVGEILDVDGRIGGFNFQWAWSSAFVAGTALARAASPPAAPAG